MFRNILNSNQKGNSKGAKMELKTANETSSIDDNAHCAKSISSTATKSSTMWAIRARGKKRFSSMMNKLRKSGRRFRLNSSSKDRENSHKSNLPFEFDDDDDDVSYKSAEEGDYFDEEVPHESMQVEKCTSTKEEGKPKGDANKGKKFSIDSEEKFVLPEEQCDIPTFLHTENCDKQLIDETRRLLREIYAKTPDSFYDNDYKRMLIDDWTVSRFLLRRRLNPKRTVKLMEECGRFRKQYKMSEVQLWEFPIEFHKAGGLFTYAPDRVGNITMYMRVKMYRRVPEISDVFKAMILCVLEQCDVATNGRGTAVVFDLSACSLQNVDLSFLSWLLSSFRNYCPKGVSYIIVYNLPWIMNATCKLAMTWMSASNRRALRFVYGDEIENFIPKENLPDYLGGTCKLDYKKIPEGSRPAIEVCDKMEITKQQALKIREIFKEYLDEDYDKISEKQTNLAQRQQDTISHYQDAKSTIVGPEAQETLANGIGQNNQQNQQNGTTTINPNVPVVDFVSQASKFISQ